MAFFVLIAALHINLTIIVKIEFRFFVYLNEFEISLELCKKPACLQLTRVKATSQRQSNRLTENTQRKLGNISE